MRSFFKLVFTSCLGSILALIFLFLLVLLIGFFTGLGKNDIPEKSVLLLDFNGLMPEKTNNVVNNNQFDFERPNALGVYEIIDLIKHAATDDRIDQILIKPENASMGPATMMKLADAIREAKDLSDKPIYAYADFYGQSGYLLASEADSIFMNPEGGVDLRGFGVMYMFGKELLEKVGIKMNVFYAGEFKSGAEVFYRNDMSPNNKLQTREFLQVLHDNFTDRIASNRNISKSDLAKGINNYTFSDADSSLVLNAVDGLKHWHEFENLLRDRLDLKKGRKINYIDIIEYEKKTTIKKTGTGKDKIAIVFAEGEVKHGDQGDGVVNEKVLHKAFDKIRKDDRFKAVVLRVNSPGGSSFTSEAVLQEIKSLQAEGMPVVASFGNYAASGGYYIACSADTILAEANTLTGSIGAFSVFPDASKLLEDKIGIHIDTVKTGQFATSFNMAMSLTEAEKKFIDKSNKRIYHKFISRVSEGRGMSLADVEAVAKGRVWTGEKAKELNLVDEIGGLDRAIEIAAEMANIDSYKLKEYPTIVVPQWVQMMESFDMQTSLFSQMKMPIISSELVELKRKLEFYSQEKKPLMLLPIQVTF